MSLRASRSSATGKTVCRLENSRGTSFSAIESTTILREIHALQAELFGQGVAQRRLGHEAQVYKELPDRLMGLELLEQRDPQLILGEDTLRNQNLPDMALGLRGDRLGAEARGIHRESYLLSSCTRSRAWAGLKLAARLSVRASAR